ncbi:MAG: GNAT family N-acetyltransferase [Rhizobiaceae bacterium]|nr:GNAT family N-acetyltransferase [Rhizobiaceae bacterium]
MLTVSELLPISAEDRDKVLTLNNLHAAELSFLDEARLDHLLAQAFLARKVGDVEALLLTFDQNADYDSPNFVWFQQRYPRFVYVDRVVTDERARGRGHARRLYLELFEVARAAGHRVIACEVNAQPPNPASDAFHAALGFRDVGGATIHGGVKTVRYFVKFLD